MSTQDQTPKYTLTPVSYNPFAADNSAAARQGRNGDTLLAHLTPGDYVIPVEKQTPEMQQTLKSWMGDSYSKFLAGSGNESTNPTTGFREFDSEGGGEGPGAEGGGNGPGQGAAGDSSSSGDASSGGTGNPLGGEVGTDKDLGPELGFGEAAVSGKLGAFGQPSTGLGVVDSAVNNISNNPVATAVNAGFGLITGAIPGLGIANSISGLLGGPTVGSLSTAAGRSIGGAVSSGVQGGTISSPDSSSGGRKGATGDASNIFNSSSSIDAASLLSSSTATASNSGGIRDASGNTINPVDFIQSLASSGLPTRF
jgi:hypothetical protein